MTKNIRKCLITAILFFMAFLGVCPFYLSATASLSSSGVWDMGQVEEGGIKRGTFYLKNEGRNAVSIKKINSCCGYTVKLDKWDIRPGEKVPVTLIVDASKKRQGSDQKVLTLEYSDPKRNVLTIHLSAEISPRVFKKGDVPEIMAGKLNGMMRKGKEVLMLDVREAPEFSVKHIPGALNLPRSRYNNDPGVLLEFISDMDKDVPIPIVVNCGGGIRSMYIAAKLRENGYKAYNLEGGIKAWEEAGYELVVGPGIDIELKPLAIGVEEAYEQYYLVFADRIFWVDVRSAEDYSSGHIPGAVNIPIESFAERIDEIPLGKEVVLYCDDESCGQSTTAAEIMISRGYMHPKIKVFSEGWKGWKQNGLPVEQGRT